jgi:hypothetical protein
MITQNYQFADKTEIINCVSRAESGYDAQIKEAVRRLTAN